MAESWIGTKKVLVIPTIVTGSNLYFPPPDNWKEQVFRRIHYDPHPTSGIDRSLKAYIHAISYGKAQLNIDISDPISVPNSADNTCRTSAAIQAHPSSHLYDFAFVIFTDGPNDCGGMATWGSLFDFSPDREGNILRGKARVKMGQSLGVWAMELLHIVTEFGDLYFEPQHPGRFDEMACNCGTHPSVFTKIHMGWISASSAPFLQSNVESRDYNLHAVGLLQPPPTGRVSAVRIRIGNSGNYYIVECRLKVDQFENITEGCSSGIPSEGVVVYKFDNTSWPSALQLVTTQALSVGQEIELSTVEVKIQVLRSIVGGIRIRIQATGNRVCNALQEEIANHNSLIRNLQEQLQNASPNQKPAILQEISLQRNEIRAIKIRMAALGCPII